MNRVKTLFFNIIQTILSKAQQTDVNPGQLFLHLLLFITRKDAIINANLNLINTKIY